MIFTCTGASSNFAAGAIERSSSSILAFSSSTAASLTVQSFVRGACRLRRIGVRGRGAHGLLVCSSCVLLLRESRKQALEVYRPVLVHPDLGGQTSHGHAADADRISRDSHDGFRDHDLRYLDPVLVDAARAQAEFVYLDRGQRQVELSGRAERQPVPSAKVDRAARSGCSSARRREIRRPRPRAGPQS